MGSRDDAAAKIDKNTEVYLSEMINDVENNKEQVLISTDPLCVIYVLPYDWAVRASTKC